MKETKRFKTGHLLPAGKSQQQANYITRFPKRKPPKNDLKYTLDTIFLNQGVQGSSTSGAHTLLWRAKRTVFGDLGAPGTVLFLHKYSG